MKTLANFKVNTSIKDIIGKDLINNPNMAIIELIKNAKDSGSKCVEIIFERNTIIIKDNGCGMSLDDIENKWLNIGYSFKKNQNSNTIYAGNKGIGRFSCDSLGERLMLITKTFQDKDFNFLYTDWKKFESLSINDQITNIPLYIRTISHDRLSSYDFINTSDSGTCLIIRGLRGVWNKKEIESLKKYLEKFIIDPETEFKIYFSVKYLVDRKKNTLFYDKYEIENKWYNKLNFRNTYIESKIKRDKINTSLFHNGYLVYKVSENNPYKYLHDIELRIYYLNEAAKRIFKNNNNIDNVNYGSIFLFLNTFRVYPYGEKGDDWLSLDKRKTQGYARHLGSREVLGFVKINDNTYFKPVSSREGLVHNNAYDELTSMNNRESIIGYIPKIFKNLESFIVQALNWDKVVGKLKDYSDPLNAKFISRDRETLEAFPKLLNSFDSNSKMETNGVYLDTLNNNISKDEKELLLSKIAIKSDIITIMQDLSHKNNNLETENKDLKKRLEKSKQEQEQAIKDVKAEIQQNNALKKINLFLQADLGKNADDILNLHHQIAIYVGSVQTAIELLIDDIQSDTYKNNDFLESLYDIKQEITKIEVMTSYAINKNFKIASTVVEANIIDFLSDYLDRLSNKSNKLRSIKVINKLKGLNYKVKFLPIDVMIIVDNLISNSQHANATEICFYYGEDKNIFYISDNGIGLTENLIDSNSIFLKGYTTTNGSGRGLHHVKEVLFNLGFSIYVIKNNNYTGLTLGIYYDRV